MYGIPKFIVCIAYGIAKFLKGPVPGGIGLLLFYIGLIRGIIKFRKKGCNITTISKTFCIFAAEMTKICIV